MKISSQMNERIRFLRENKGYTQQEVADMLGVSRAVYGMYEGGTRSISVEVIINLSHIYGVSTDFILGLSNNTKFEGSSIEPYLTDTAVKTITNMGNSSDKKALKALNVLLSDKQCYKLFDSLYKVLYTPTIVPNSVNIRSLRESDEFDTEVKAKAYLKELLGLSDFIPDYSDEIIEKIASEIGINTKYISKDIRSVAKMLFMVQFESFIERNLSRRYIRKTILSEE